ncbi:MAG TPA: DNA alkylation repair protein, partial [Armatimonadota bacterium]|nr:DNA alkylation repair protein [Armatimonadota bacterium]
MSAAQMSFDEVFTQLQAWGTEMWRKIYIREGAGDNHFGAPMGSLRGLAKKLKRDHALALRLWETGNTDAVILATMLFDASRLTEPEVESMVRSLTYVRLVDELVYNTIADTPFEA